MIRALHQLAPGEVAFYRDTPYAIRNPSALPHVSATESTVVPIGAGLDRKIAASCAYASQIGFQFQGPAALAEAMRAFAFSEGRGQAAERFLGRIELGERQP